MGGARREVSQGEAVVATLLRSDGSYELVYPGEGKRLAFTLAELQAFVGGYIQVLYVDDAVLFMNEDGKSRRLPLNVAATVLGRRAGIAASDFVVGDVLVCSRVEAGDGHVTDT
jgi:hypothetical protein